jgi:hypothetical protein
VPEEVYRAGLAVEPAAELLEDGVRPVEDSAEAPDRLSIPGRVPDVLRKRRRHRDPERLLRDLDVDAELGEHRVETGVEVRDGHPVAELEHPVASVGGPHEQGVIEEVESDLEGRPAKMETPCREPADVDVEGISRYLAHAVRPLILAQVVCEHSVPAPNAGAVLSVEIRCAT